uniref:Uncharacterized protein n=1 Tax=Brassica oleracea var. oleracea TaxID=109376 RepID=A0A0D3CG36_BRAOL
MTSRKSSELPGIRLTESSPMSLRFITDLSVFFFNQMVLIFHSFKGFSDLEDFWDDLPVSRLNYRLPDDFQEVFQTTSRMFSRRLPGSLPDDFQEVFQEVLQTTSRKSSDEVFFHVKWSPSLSL